MEEFTETLKSAHNFLKSTQVPDNPPNFEKYYRQMSKVRFKYFWDWIQPIGKEMLSYDRHAACSGLLCVDHLRSGLNSGNSDFTLGHTSLMGIILFKILVSDLLSNGQIFVILWWVWTLNQRFFTGWVSIQYKRLRLDRGWLHCWRTEVYHAPPGEMRISEGRRRDQWQATTGRRCCEFLTHNWDRNSINADEVSRFQRLFQIRSWLERPPAPKPHSNTQLLNGDWLTIL